MDGRGHPDRESNSGARCGLIGLRCRSPQRPSRSAMAKRRSAFEASADRSRLPGLFDHRPWPIDGGVRQTVPFGLSLSHHARPFHWGEETVEAGGFNYAAAAEAKNAENVLVLHDPLVAHRYGKQWDRLWAESDELKGRY